LLTGKVTESLRLIVDQGITVGANNHVDATDVQVDDFNHFNATHAQLEELEAYRRKCLEKTFPVEDEVLVPAHITEESNVRFQKIFTLRSKNISM
jgi:hypothetical protein